MNQYQQRFTKFSHKFDGHEAVFERMITIFLQDAPQRLDEIRDAHGEHAWEEISRAAHSLVNIAGTMQAFEAAEQARKLEAAVRARAYRELPDLIDSVETEIGLALAVVEGLHPQA